MLGPVSIQVFNITRPSDPQDANLTKHKSANVSKQQTLRTLRSTDNEGVNSGWGPLAFEFST